MKLLRNPIVTGLLVVAAIGMVLYQILAPRWERGRATVPQPVAAAVTAVARALAPPPPVTIPHPTENAALAELTPEASVDREYAKAHFDAWVESPARDPFLLLGAQPVDPQELGTETNSPIKKMKYKGLVDQTGGRVVVIEFDARERIYERGDEIVPGYKILDITGDEIQFQGPRRIERLGREPPKTRTNSIPAARPPARQP